MAKKHVFISYCHDNEAEVARLCQDLVAEGERVWWDKNILPGQIWKREIDKAMKQSYAVILCLSKETASRATSGIYREARDAITAYREYGPGSVFLIPVRLSQCEIPPIEIDDTHMLDAIQHLDLFPASKRAAGFKGLLKAIRTAPLHPTGPAAHAGATPVGRTQIAPSRLRHGAYRLFGREKELASLEQAWADPSTHVVVILAWGGVGKTSLVIEWLAQRAAAGWPGFEAFFDWSFYDQGTRQGGAVSADLFTAEALKWFGDPDMAQSGESAWDKGARLAELVGQQRALLVLDGVEPLQDPPGQVAGRLRDEAVKALLAGLAQRNRGLCILTSRQAIPELDPWLDKTVAYLGEREFEGSRYPSLSSLSTDAGIELLEVLGVRGPKGELRKLVEDVGAHALTLSLMGSYLVKAHGGDIRKRDRVEFEKADAEVQGGHAFKTMSTYEKWLAEGGEDGTRQLAVLRLLALFDRPADPTCMDALLLQPRIPGLTEPLLCLSDAEWNVVLFHLEDARLVRTSPYVPRTFRGFSKEKAQKRMQSAAQGIDFPLGEPELFVPRALYRQEEPKVIHVHPLLREYFAHRLQETNLAAWREGHRRLYEHLKASVPHWPEGSDGIEPLYEAVVHGCQAGLYREALDEVFRSRIRRGRDHYSLYYLGAAQSDHRALSGLLETRGHRPVHRLDDHDRVYAMNEAGSCLRSLGLPEESIALIGESLRVSEELADWDRATASARNLAGALIAVGELGKAIVAARKAVECAEWSKWPFDKYANHCWLARALHMRGDRVEALCVFQEAERRAKEDGKKLVGLQAAFFCELLLELGEWQEADRRARAAVSNRTPWRRDNALCDLVLGEVLLWPYRHFASRKPFQDSHADLAESNAKLVEAKTGLRGTGRQDEVPICLFPLAALYRLKGAWDDAWCELDEAREIAQRGEMRLYVADYYLESARLLLAQGKGSQAHEHYARAKDLVETANYHRRDSELAELAKVLQTA